VRSFGKIPDKLGAWCGCVDPGDFEDRSWRGADGDFTSCSEVVALRLFLSVLDTPLSLAPPRISVSKLSGTPIDFGSGGASGGGGTNPHELGGMGGGGGMLPLGVRGATTFRMGGAGGMLLLEPELAGELLDTACNRASRTFGFGGGGDPGVVGEEIVLFGMVGALGLVFVDTGKDREVEYVAVDVEL
jgi:hypothetical protein